MNPSTAPEAPIEEIGGEPLAGSGFETEDPESAFELGQHFAEEVFAQ